MTTSLEAKRKALGDALPKERPQAFIRYAQAVIQAKQAGQLNVEKAGYKICGCIFFDELMEVPELEEAISIGCDLELPPQHRSSANEAKSWTRLEYLIEEYAAGRRQGISQRIRIEAELRNARNQVTASATGWVFLKYGRAWVSFGIPLMKQTAEATIKSVSTPLTNTGFLADVCKRLDGTVVDGYTFVAKVVDQLSGDGHSEFHSRNAFCGYAGEEEMKHFRWLIDQLTDSELKKLTEAAGIHFRAGDAARLTREDYENVIDEADRDDFYREYHKLVSLKRVKKS